MKVLGIESSCDETGVALYDSERGLLAHALHTQVAMHEAYGGVVPELASRDHIRRLMPLLERCCAEAARRKATSTPSPTPPGPGWPARCWSAPASPKALALALGMPALPVHHLEGHLLSPLLSSDPPSFPFVALLVSGGHTQLMRVAQSALTNCSANRSTMPPARPSTRPRKLLGLGYPGGPALAQLAETGTPGRFKLPRPMLNSGDFSFSFSGLKTAVLTAVRGAMSCLTERQGRSRRGVSGSGHRSAGDQGLGGVPPAPTVHAGGRRRRRRQPAPARSA